MHNDQRNPQRKRAVGWVVAPENKWLQIPRMRTHTNAQSTSALTTCMRATNLQPQDKSKKVGMLEINDYALSPLQNAKK